MQKKVAHDFRYDPCSRKFLLDKCRDNMRVHARIVTAKDQLWISVPWQADYTHTHNRRAIIYPFTNLSQWGSSSRGPKGRLRRTDPQLIPGSTWASPPEPAWWGKESRRRLWIIQYILDADHYISVMYSKSTVCPQSKGGPLNHVARDGVMLAVETLKRLFSFFLAKSV